MSETQPLNNAKKLKRVVRSESPPPLRKKFKRPYKTIVLTLFLLFSGLLFLQQGWVQTEEKGIGETYPMFILAIMLLIPGGYHFVLWMLIVFNVEGFTYEMLPQIQN